MAGAVVVAMVLTFLLAPSLGFGLFWLLPLVVLGLVIARAVNVFA